MQKEKQAAIYLLQFSNLGSGCQAYPQKQSMEKMPTQKLCYLQIYWKNVFIGIVFMLYCIKSGC